jgi:ABC-2 type transport system ATP-binding protein
MLPYTGVSKHPVLKVPTLSDWAIEAKGLVRTFGDVEAVKGIDLSIPEGGSIAFLDPTALARRR